MIGKRAGHIKMLRKDTTKARIKRLEDNRGIKIKRITVEGERFYAAYFYERPNIPTGKKAKLVVFGSRLYKDIDMLEEELKLYRVNKLGGPHGR